MKYVFDTSPFSVLFKNFYRKQFPTLWERFDELVEEGLIVSTREVAREIQDCPIENLREWAREHENLFTTPTAARQPSSPESLPCDTFSRTSRDRSSTRVANARIPSLLQGLWLSRPLS